MHNYGPCRQCVATQQHQNIEYIPVVSKVIVSVVAKGRCASATVASDR